MNKYLRSAKLSLLLFIFASILFISIACPSGTPTTPTKPKKKAVLTISSSKEPIVIVYSLALGYGLCEPTFTVSESNGVGATIQTIKVEFIRSSGSSSTQSLSQRKISAHGNFSFIIFQQLYTRNYTKISVQLDGKDDNGYQIREKKDFVVTYFIF